MTALRKRIAERLVEGRNKAAILSTFNECDMSRVLALREEHKEKFLQKHGVKLGFMSFFVKAVIEALKAFPAINAEIQGDTVVYRNYYDVGVAVGSGKGLVVPVIRNAEALSFAEVEKTVEDFGKRAKENRLMPDDLAGGTFTISNGGVYGSLLSTPLLNPPQSGILGMHAIQKRPVAIGEQVVVRPMMYLARPSSSSCARRTASSPPTGSCSRSDVLWTPVTRDFRFRASANALSFSGKACDLVV
jgi:2-oxoglutarate dehydrogenase E2 component (dihydrolipoamide succinyltransferase)